MTAWGVNQSVTSPAPQQTETWMPRLQLIRRAQAYRETWLSWSSCTWGPLNEGVPPASSCTTEPKMLGITYGICLEYRQVKVKVKSDLYVQPKMHNWNRPTYSSKSAANKRNRAKRQGKGYSCPLLPSRGGWRLMPSLLEVKGNSCLLLGRPSNSFISNSALNNIVAVQFKGQWKAYKETKGGLFRGLGFGAFFVLVWGFCVFVHFVFFFFFLQKLGEWQPLTKNENANGSSK